MDRHRSRFLYFRIAPWFSCRFCEEHMLAGRPQRQTPPAAQAAARLTSLIPHRPPVPDREDFAGITRQTAGSGWRRSLPPRWSITGQLPSGRCGGNSAGSALVRRGFLCRKRMGPKACPFLNRWEKDRLIVGCVDLEECLGMCTLRGKPREPSRPRGCSRSWSTAHTTFSLLANTSPFSTLASSLR